MTVSIRTSRAAIVAAVLSVFGAAPALGIDMPADCENDLDKCSEKIWAHDSFPHKGVTQSVVFSNAMRLTCTSRGRDIPRFCQLTLDEASLPTPPDINPSPELPAASDTDPKNCPQARFMYGPDRPGPDYFSSYEEAHKLGQQVLASGHAYCYLVVREGSHIYLKFAIPN